MNKIKKCQTAVYYFPNYHVDKINEKLHGRGWTEWELVKAAKPRFKGHEQPKVPLWGFEDEADPAVMSKKIDAAADYGIDAFIFDWYWHDQGPFLWRALEEGFLKAQNNERLKFALMWANHDWINVHPADYCGKNQVQMRGEVKPETFDNIVNHVIENYFKHPSYWKINGCPYFSIYELHTLIKGFGGIDKTISALNAFREKVKQAGFPDLHLNAVLYGVKILPNEKTIDSPEQMLAALKFDSITSYVWIHHYRRPDFPITSYEKVMDANIEVWKEYSKKFSLPYYPNVTMGWDSSPRTVQTDSFENVGYPFGPIMATDPASFKVAMDKAVNFLSDRDESQRILTINAWNEWTEGSYLEPDTVNGYAYLEGIKNTVYG